MGKGAKEWELEETHGYNVSAQVWSKPCLLTYALGHSKSCVHVQHQWIEQPIMQVTFAPIQEGLELGKCKHSHKPLQEALPGDLSP